MSLKDQVILVTGGSAGIGAALAEAAAKRGAHLAVVARREDELRAVAKKCGDDALAIVADVTKADDVRRACEVTISAFGHLDVWVNNAGRGMSRMASQLTDEDIDDMILVNVKSVWNGVRAVLPHFKERKRGHIINVSSMLARVPFAGIRAGYSASKAAMCSLTASLRMELRAEFPNIFITAVHPGIVATDFGLNAQHGGMDSRKLPGAQDAAEVADVFCDVIARPRADEYTRPSSRQMVANYYAAEDMGKAEGEPPFVFPPRP